MSNNPIPNLSTPFLTPDNKVVPAWARFLSQLAEDVSDVQSLLADGNAGETLTKQPDGSNGWS